MNPVKIIKLWRLAKKLNDAADRGDVTLTVPRWLAPELKSLIWRRKVDRASEKWASNVSAISPEDWERAIRQRSGRAGNYTHAQQFSDQACPECGLLWREISPDCPRKIYDRHPGQLHDDGRRW